MDKLSLQMNPDLIFEQGLKALESGNCHESLNLIKRAFKYGKSPEYSGILVRLANQFMSRELWKEAEESLLETLRVDPDNNEALTMIKTLHSCQERFCDIRPHHSPEQIKRRKDMTVLSEVPLVQLFIELTNHCNARCITCLNRKMKRKRGVMDFQLFKKIVDESSRHMYLELVHLYGVGEDYLIPDVIDYFNYAVRKYSERGIKTVLITNGERITDLPEGITAVDISFNGGRKETYEKITGLNFDKTVRNIWRLEREGQLDHRKNIHMLVYDDNVSEVDEFKKLYAFTSANMVMAYKYDNQCGEIEDKTVSEYRTGSRIPCHYVRNVMNIAWNGDVILCPHDFEGVVNYGSAAENSLTEIWHGGLHTDLLKKHSASVFDGICEKCNFNVPIEGKNEIVSREERIALRKKHLDYALKHMVCCPKRKNCKIVETYRDTIDELESDSREPLIRICSDDYRFYGIDALKNEEAHAHCPELARLRRKHRELRISWEAPTFGPSGYAFAARGYMCGLEDVGLRLRVQPIWGDCKIEYEDVKKDE